MSLIRGEESWAQGYKEALRAQSVLCWNPSASAAWIYEVSWGKGDLGPAWKGNASPEHLSVGLAWCSFWRDSDLGTSLVGLSSAARLGTGNYQVWIFFFCVKEFAKHPVTQVGPATLGYLNSLRSSFHL